jgi:2-keto-3-deoxy-L-rhamnonate aldolase RhmA
MESIAAVEGVDVLFVGPLDLSISLDMPGRFDDPAFREVLSKVGEAAKAAGKAAGILLPGTDLIKLVHSLGFTFVAVGADGGMVINGLSQVFEALSSYK